MTGADDIVEVSDSPLCVFWLAGRCLGLDVRLVGELVTLQATTPVPMARGPVRGIFNLRGAPIVVVDLAAILDLGDHPTEQSRIGLVLRIGELVAAGRVDRMEAVIPAGRGELVPRDTRGDHPAVLGFLDDRAAGGRVVTVIDPGVLVQRLNALRYLDAPAA